MLPDTSGEPHLFPFRCPEAFLEQRQLVFMFAIQGKDEDYGIRFRTKALESLLSLPEKGKASGGGSGSRGGGGSCRD